MGFVPGLFGAGQIDYQAKGAPIALPTTADQAQQTYANTIDSVGEQNKFLQALQAQNGIGNQNQTYGQMQDIVAGNGANPAQAMLANATGQNVAQQAALMAGQRGAGANPALIARLAAQQGANIQQQAAGQGAALQANQSLSALNNAANIANTQVNQQANATNAYNQGAQNMYGTTLGAIQGQNNTILQDTNQTNQLNAKIAAQNAETTADAWKGLGNALGADSAFHLMGSTSPGEAKTSGGGGGGFSGGGSSEGGGGGGGQGQAQGGGIVGSGSKMMAFLAKGGTVPNGTPGGPVSFVGQHFHAMAKGGKVPIIVSPGEVVIPQEKVAAAASSKHPEAKGKAVPGKAKVSGDSYSNDTVPMKAKAGDVVLPRSVTQSPDSGEKAAKFLQALMAHNGMKGKKS